MERPISDSRNTPTKITTKLLENRITYNKDTGWTIDLSNLGIDDSNLERVLKDTYDTYRSKKKI
jgi:hypothetical protein